MLSLTLFPKNDALCQTPPSPSESDAKQMVTKFRAALEKHDTLQANQIGRELQTLGKTVLPAIRDALPDCSEAEKRQFISVLTGIAGNETAQLLLQLACQSPDTNVVSAALNAIGNRPINFALTASQFEWLLGKLSKGHVFNAATAARLLARCQRNNTSRAVNPILERFVEEIENPTNLGKIHGSYLSPRVYTLNLFLLAFADMNEKAASEVKDAIKKATIPETQKWLTLALGMCGDQSVAQDIRFMIKNDPDVSFRCVAVHAYARSDGEKAVTFLKTLLTDSSQSEYDWLPDGSPVYPVRLAAQDELARLRSKSCRQQDN